MRRHVLRHARFLLALAVLPAGCAPGQDLPLVANPPALEYRLGGGDQVRIIVLGGDELSGEYRLDGDGRIAVPLLGTVNAGGLTVAQFQQELTNGLKRGQILRDPSVSVQVQTYRPVFVLGEVAKPGEYPYQPGMTMLTVVAVAGGFTYRGVQDYAAVVRSDRGTVIEGKVEPGSRIVPGDVVKVFERRF